jgi:GMP synthase-like glutamine amidotransferase
VIGVCFGHQIIGRAAGVKVGRSDKGWEIAVLPIELSPRGKELFEQDTMVHALRIGFLFPADGPLR